MKLLNKKAAPLVKKMLVQAANNAAFKNSTDKVPRLVVTKCYSSKGNNLKRMEFRAKGKVNQILVHHAHLWVEVTQYDEDKYQQIKNWRSSLKRGKYTKKHMLK